MVDKSLVIHNDKEKGDLLNTIITLKNVQCGLARVI